MSSNLSGNVTQGTGITDTLEVVLIKETLENVTVTLEEDPGLKKVSYTLKDVLAYTLKNIGNAMKQMIFYLLGRKINSIICFGVILIIISVIKWIVAQKSSSKSVYEFMEVIGYVV